jgi:hypothetical protein
VTRISWLAPGPTLLRAGGRDGLARVAREVDTREETSIELVVPIGFEAVFPDLRRATDRSYVLEDSAGLPLHAGDTLPRSVWLAPGEYALRTFVAGVDTARVPFRMGQERQVVRTEGR